MPTLGIPSGPLYRDYLDNTSPAEERDIDFCVPSGVLPAFFTKWQLVFAPINGRTEINLALAAPRWVLLSHHSGARFAMNAQPFCTVSQTMVYQRRLCGEE